MKSVPEPKSDPETTVRLAKRCSSLCRGVEAALAKLPTQREHFLATSLEDALRQLELVLRVIEYESKKVSDSRQGLLRRLFSRANTPETEEEPFDIPDFDISKQGLQGNSLTVSMSELLNFLAYGRKTGVLWVDTPEENFLIGLQDGRLMHATSDHTPEGLRLGEILVGFGYMTRRQLERFLSQSKESEGSISGEILLDTGVITADELRYALQYQVKQLVTRLLGTKNAVFRFREGMEVMVAYQINMGVNELLIESARLHDEVKNPQERQAVLQSDWNAWQAELNANIETISGDDTTSEAEDEGETVVLEEPEGDLVVADEGPPSLVGKVVEHDDDQPAAKTAGKPTQGQLNRAKGRNRRNRRTRRNR